jgi:cholesterol transport system auxiliary component
VRCCVPLLFTLLFSLVVFNGCATAPGVVPTHYTLTPTEKVTAPATATYGKVLQVARVSAPSWLNSRDIYYQLLYQDKETISAYSQAQWISTPPVLIGRLLENQLNDSHLWKAVVSSDSNAVSDMTLHLDLREFQQKFSSPKKSYGVLRASATIIDNQSGEVLAQRDFHYRESAPQSDARGGVAALNRATNEMLAAVSGWLVQVMERKNKGA